MTEINCCLVLGLVREGRSEVGACRGEGEGASESCAGGDQKGLDAVGEEEPWHS